MLQNVPNVFSIRIEFFKFLNSISSTYGTLGNSEKNLPKSTWLFKVLFSWNFVGHSKIQTLLISCLFHRFQFLEYLHGITNSKCFVIFPFNLSVRKSGFKFDADENFHFCNTAQLRTSGKPQDLFQKQTVHKLASWPPSRSFFKICIIFYWPIKTVASLVENTDEK